MIKEFKYKNKLIAIIIKSDEITKSQFFTDDASPLQIGCFCHKKGTIVKAHTHKEITRTISHTGEVLIVTKGSARLDLYSNEKEYIESTIIQEGDIVYLIDGGHGLKCVNDLKMFEIKQGPYIGLAEKERFSEIEDEKVIINE